jgi:hypothetical protein
MTQKKFDVNENKELTVAILKIGCEANRVSSWLGNSRNEMSSIYNSKMGIRAVALKVWADNISAGIVLLNDGRISLKSFAYYVDQRYRIDRDMLEYYEGVRYESNDDMANCGGGYLVNQAIRERVSGMIKGFFKIFDEMVKSQNIKIKTYVPRTLFVDGREDMWTTSLS